MTTLSLDRLCYTIDEIHNLKIIPLGKNKLYELVNSGKLQPLKVGRKILISRYSLEQFLKNGF